MSFLDGFSMHLSTVMNLVEFSKLHIGCQKVQSEGPISQLDNIFRGYMEACSQTYTADEFRLFRLHLISQCTTA